MDRLWPDLIAFLGQPEVRAFTTVLSVLSFVISVWAVKKTREVLHAHELDIKIRHDQFIDQQWNRINFLALESDAGARALARIYGVDDVESVKTASFYIALVNLLASAYSAWINGLLDEKLYAAHFASAAFFFRNDVDVFLKAAPKDQYLPAFLEDCKKRFARLQRLSAQDLRDQVVHASIA